MEKIKSAHDLRSVFVRAMISLYENDEKTYEQVENELIALIEERDRQIFDLARKQNNWGEFKLGSTNDLYPEGIKKEE